MKAASRDDADEMTLVAAPRPVERCVRARAYTCSHGDDLSAPPGVGGPPRGGPVLGSRQLEADVLRKCQPLSESEIDFYFEES